MSIFIPKKRMGDYYICHHIDTVVTDEKEIARLERGEVRENETINRPLTVEEIENIEKRETE